MWCSRKFWPVATAAALFTSSSAGQANDSLVLWDKSLNLRGAFGYKDNVLLSRTQRDSSAFWQSAFDATLLRISADKTPNSFSLFISGEDRRYFSAAEISKEQLFLTHLKWEQTFLENWSVGAVAQYMYADQVFDATAADGIFFALPVKSHNLQAAPFLVRKLPGKSRIEFKLSLERQIFNESLDDYWEGGPEVSFKKAYGNKSEFAASYTYDHRTYDTRWQYRVDGTIVPNTSLKYNQHEFELSLTHVWDKARHWRNRLRFVYERSEDNGPGYFDYNRFRWGARFGYYGNDWETTVEGKVLHYDYVKQHSGPSGERKVWEYGLSFRAQKRVWKALNIFAEYEHETVHSSLVFEEYYVNTVLSGVDWEF